MYRIEDFCSKIIKNYEFIWEPADHSRELNRNILVLDKYSNLWKNSRNAYLEFRSVILKKGARGGAVGWGTALQTGRSRVRFPMVLSFRPHYGPGVDSASNRNVY
jgi:hypothetical protein